MLRYPSQMRAERGVALARLLLAAALLAVEVFSPRQSLAGSPVAIVLALYTALAALLTIGAFARPLVSRRLRWVGHLIDLTVFVILVALTRPGEVPRLLYALFPVASAAVRLTTRGFVIASAAVIVIYTAVAMASVSAGAPVFQVLVQILVLTIVCLLMAHLRSGEESVRSQLTQLALWKQEMPEELPIRQMLEHVRDVFRSARTVLAWEETDEPWLHLAWMSDSDFRWIRESPVKFDPIVAEGVDKGPFLCHDVRVEKPRVLVLEREGVVERRLRPLHPALLSRFSVRSVVGVPVRGATFSGVLLVLDRTDFHPEDLYLGSVVGEFLSNHIDVYYLLDRQAETAVEEERIRLSRDLHDGVLQSLTGAALQLEAVRRLVEKEPAKAIERLGEIQKIMAHDQRELRAFIRQLRPATGKHASDMRLRTRLSDLRDRFRTQWGVEVEIDTERLSHTIFHGLRNEIYSVINEAVANAAKHSSATRMKVEVSSESRAVRICIEDNGQGFPFFGRFSLEELDQQRRGPVTLKERIASLRGELILESTPTGSKIEMHIPVDFGGASWLSAS